MKKSGTHWDPSNTARVAQGSNPARAAASAKQQPSSPVIVDLCSSPQPRQAGTSSGTNRQGPVGMQAAVAGSSDATNEVEMMDISQSPVKHIDGASGSAAAAPARSCMQGSKANVLGLAMGAAMSGSADPYWQRLSDLIVQGGIAGEHADELRQVFAEEQQDKWRGHVPAYLLSGNHFVTLLCIVTMYRLESVCRLLCLYALDDIHNGC